MFQVRTLERRMIRSIVSKMSRLQNTHAAAKKYGPIYYFIITIAKVVVDYVRKSTASLSRNELFNLSRGLRD